MYDRPVLYSPGVQECEDDLQGGLAEGGGEAHELRQRQQGARTQLLVLTQQLPVVGREKEWEKYCLSVEKLTRVSG